MHPFLFAYDLMSFVIPRSLSDMTTPISDIASVIHHGGKHTVTGSCHELKLPHGSILNDCGLFQGKTSIWQSQGIAGY